MKPIRIIPRLDIKGPNLVKGIHFEGLRVLGKPQDFAYQYYLDGADELIYMDVVASLYGRNSLLDIVRSTAEKIFIPLTVGGGIRSIEDIRSALRAGADKVAINTAAIKNPDLVKEAANVFGSQCIIISIEAKRQNNGRYEVYIDNGRDRTEKNVFEWVRYAYELGAGEILITSVDKEGTGSGFDLELVKKVSELVPIPIIACGGAGNKEHFYQIIKGAKVDAVSAASVFHYQRLNSIVDSEKFQEEGNIEYLKNYAALKQSFSLGRIASFSIGSLKTFLAEKDIFCRITDKQEINA